MLRVGELLKEIPDKAGGGSPPHQRSQRAKAASNAGLSKDQRKTALRVALVPKDTFEALVESDNPPMAASGGVLPIREFTFLKSEDVTPEQFAPFAV
jgi:hypothetical protein